MQQNRVDLDPFAGDPGRWGHSLLNLSEVMIPCLVAAGARSVTEVGAYAGDLTEVLVDWGETAGARIVAIDPSPQERLVRLAEERDGLALVRDTSLAALARLPLTDAVIIDGDHNYFTVREELRLIASAAGGDLPLLLFHDVGWPHGRRDDYYDPTQVPAEHRQPITPGGGLFPDEPGIRVGGLPYRSPATREGGAGNGVLTAVEDFAGERDDLRLAIVPAFFGLGVVWSADAAYADALGAVLAPWDGNPLVARLEGNRVFHLASAHVQLVETALAQQRLARQEAVLRRLLDSSAFALAERLSRLRHRAGIARGDAAVSKQDIRAALRD